ncbi:MAG TPA: hypothetical protein VK721_13835 [Solirubrobacteraceae bacterium]|jgi:hypothetical protein|nr:hypothetical protein [Solirubrobacteraceae bacterium]
MSKGKQINSRSERERLRAAVSWLHTRTGQQEREIEGLRRSNDELRVALEASDVLLGVAMDVARERRTR